MPGLVVSSRGDDYYNIATYRATQGDYEMAIEKFSKAIEKNSNDAEAYLDSDIPSTDIRRKAPTGEIR